MITLKFGGTSMANARRILASADIIINRAKEDRLSVVVSAAAGVSNTLQAAIDACTLVLLCYIVCRRPRVALRFQAMGRDRALHQPSW